MVGIDSRENCFSHGQFYITWYRVGFVSSLIILAPNGNTNDVVYKETLGWI